MLGKMSKAVIAVFSMAVVFGLLAGCTGGGDFTISVAPITAFIAAGKSGTVTVNVARTDGFKGEVTFALIEAPTGVRGRFTPIRITRTGTQSILTLTVNSTVAVGDYSLKVTATSGKLKKEANLTLSVLVVADFRLETAPTAITVRQGTTSSPVRVNIKRTPTFTNAVTLALEGAPAGVKATFDPVSTTDGQSALSLEVIDTAKPGEYTLTVRGKGGDLDRTVKLTLSVKEPFSMSVAPRSVTVRQDATSSPIAVSLKRAAAFVDAVALTIENAPAGVSGSFSSPSVTADEGTLTIRVAAAVQAGEYPLTICGKAGGLDKTVKLTLTVVEPFSMSVEPRAVMVRQKAAISPITVSLKRAATFTDAVALTIQGAPAVVSGSFSPPSATANEGTLTIQVAEDASPGAYNLQVTGTSGLFTKTVSLKLVVFTKESLNVAFSTQALEILPEWERIEQVRDWIVHAFLAAREVPADRIAVSLHSQPPLRQPALSEVHTWQYGIGRWVWVDDDPMDDSVGDLYAFLPAEADQQLLGGLADDFRRTMGEVPAFVHHVAYEIDDQVQTASFAFIETLTGEVLFADGGKFGYCEREICTQTDLKRFLRQIDELVCVSMEGGKLTLGGRDLPGRSPAVSVEDVAVLYQAYQKADVRVQLGTLATALRQAYPRLSSTNASALAAAIHKALTEGHKGSDQQATILCRLYGIDTDRAVELYVKYVTGGSIGFSLDPDGAADHLSLFSELSNLEVQSAGVDLREWMGAVLEVLQRQLLPLHQAMQKLLDEGTEEARKVYSKISSLLGRYACQCARYDGDIQGTSVGMTLFYCDLLAKLWLYNYDGSTPTEEIGLIPILGIPVASVYWEEIWKYSKGRLWFGPNWEMIGRGTDFLTFSPVTTQIFTRASDPTASAGEEVKPTEERRSWTLWWEAHWPEIMEYEPEYYRLNEITKFSALMAWLQESGGMSTLCFLEQERVTRTHEFDTWLEENRDRLAFKAWLPFTGASAGGTECLSLLCAESQAAFGSPSAFRRGGVSLAEHRDLAKVHKLEDYSAATQRILHEGRGTLADPGGTEYRFTALGSARATPTSGVRFRTPVLTLSQVQNVSYAWERASSGILEYSSSIELAAGQTLDEQVSLECSENLITVTVDGTAWLAQRLAQGLVGQLELPWDYINEIRYEKGKADLYIQTPVGWFLATQRELRSPLLEVGSTAVAYEIAVSFAQDLDTSSLIDINLDEVKEKIDALRESEMGCLIYKLGETYWTASDVPGVAAFPIEARVIEVLNGNIAPEEVDDTTWEEVKTFFRHFISVLPPSVKIEFWGREIDLDLGAPEGVLLGLDVPTKELREVICKLLGIETPEPTGLRDDSMKGSNAC